MRWLLQSTLFFYLEIGIVYIHFIDHNPGQSMPGRHTADKLAAQLIDVLKTY